MKVAYLVSRYPAVNHTYILREVRGLRALGMDVRVASILAPDRPPEELGPEEREEAALAFYVRPLGALRILADVCGFLLRRPVVFFRGLAFALGLSRWDLRAAAAHLLFFAEAIVAGLWMRRESLTHAHTHFASTPALFLQKLFPVTISATIHGPAEFIDPAGFLLPEKIHAARFTVAISQYGRSQSMRFSAYADWHKLHIARMGVETDRYTPTVPATPPYILFVGQLAPAKGVHILVQACATLNVALRIVGDGPERSSLERLIDELGMSARVTLEGALSHHRVLELYRSASIFAMASFAEGIPVVLMEAMAMEIPCVATRITGIPELIEDGVSGLLVPPSSAAALAAAIQRLLDDSSLRASLGSAGRRRVLDEYDAHRNIQQLHAIFLKPGNGLT